MFIRYFFIALIISYVVGQGSYCQYGPDAYQCGSKLPNGQVCNRLQYSNSCFNLWCSNWLSCDCSTLSNYCKNARDSTGAEWFPESSNFTKKD